MGGPNRPFRCDPGEGRGFSRSYSGSRRRGVWSRPCQSLTRNLCNPPPRCRGCRYGRRRRQRTLVVTAATPEAVVAAVAFEAVLPAAALEVVGPTATLEAILPVGPEERIVACGAGKDLRQAWCPAKSAPTITTITVSKIYSRFIRLPSLVYVEQLMFVFFRTYHKGLYGVHGMLDIVRRLMF